MRVAIGGICHETSTFAPLPTTLHDFETGRGLYRGHEIVERFRGSNTCVGGFIQGAAEHGLHLVPLLLTHAFPSGLIVAADYAALKAELLDRLRREEQATGPIDGVLLDLHGAMVVEGIDDADGDLIAAVRAAVGSRPIIVTTDLHANHSPLRVEQATAIIGYDTYPHVDMAERGIEAAGMMAATLRGEIRPTMALRTLPLIWGTRCQVTAWPPMDEVLGRLHALEQRPGMLSATISTGFPWADVPNMCSSVIAVADGDAALARAAADELGDWIMERLPRWYHPPVSVREALAEGERIGKYPIILADHADNTGGGAGGDSTEVLQTFLEMNLRDALVLYMVDPEVARQAHAAGVGKRISVSLGGKSHPLQGPPVQAEAEVLALSDGPFHYDGPMYGGLTGSMGTSAAVRMGGVTVVVVSVREQPFDPAFARTLGINCGAMRYIAVKSSAHFRAAFEPLAGSIFNVDAQAIHTHRFDQLDYHKRPRPMFPLEPVN